MEDGVEDGNAATEGSRGVDEVDVVGEVGGPVGDVDIEEHQHDSFGQVNEDAGGLN